MLARIELFLSGENNLKFKSTHVIHMDMLVNEVTRSVGNGWIVANNFFLPKEKRNKKKL